MRFNPLKPDLNPDDHPSAADIAAARHLMSSRSAKLPVQPAYRTKPRRARAEEPEPGELIARTDHATLKTNPAKGGIELKFAAKPADDALAPLRSQWPAWKWSRFGQLWYAKDTPENRQWAKDFLCGIAPASIPAVIPAAASPATIPVAVVLVDKAPPGGWTDADRVPDHLRQPWARACHPVIQQSTHPIIPPPAPAPVKLPPRPRPFSRV